MNPLSRNPANKRNSAKQFRRNSATTAAANMRGAPMRGGIRL